MRATKPKWRVNTRRLLATGEKRYHKARVPGTVRPSRLPGGSGFRNNWEWNRPEMAEVAIAHAVS